MAAQAELPKVTYGFIGIGSMGYRMAKNLRAKLPAEATIIICDVVKPLVEKFTSEVTSGIEVAETPKEVAERSEIIITMLPQGPHVKKVFLDPNTGLLAISKPANKLFIECSTIDVPTSQEVAEAVKESGLGRFADAPVSGGPTGASAATLTFMVGGDKEVVDEIRPIVMTMGKTFFHCGGAGAGLATKQINNYLSGIKMLATAEGMNLGIKYGLDPKVLAGVINSSTGRSYNSIEQNPVKGISPNSTANNNFESGFAIELCVGVLHMGIDLGKQVGANMPLSGCLINAFETAAEDPRCKGKDCRSIWKYVSDEP